MHIALYHGLLRGGALQPLRRGSATSELTCSRAAVQIQQLVSFGTAVIVPACDFVGCHDVPACVDRFSLPSTPPQW